MAARSVDGGEWVRMIADQLVESVRDLRKLSGFTGGDKNLLGMYAEARVRELVKRFVAPLRVSRGSIVWEGASAVQETDAIVWQPSPLPALFEAGDFAIVPRGSAVGLLEIKSTNYSGARAKARKVLNAANELIPHHDLEVLKNLGQMAIGVVCIRWKGEAAVTDPDIVTLLHENDRGELAPQPESFVSLSNALNAMRQRAKVLDGAMRVKLPPAPAQTASNEPMVELSHRQAPATSEIVMGRFPRS